MQRCNAVHYLSRRCDFSYRVADECPSELPQSSLHCGEKNFLICQYYRISSEWSISSDAKFLATKRNTEKKIFYSVEEFQHFNLHQEKLLSFAGASPRGVIALSLREDQLQRGRCYIIVSRRSSNKKGQFLTMETNRFVRSLMNYHRAARSVFERAGRMIQGLARGENV